MNRKIKQLEAAVLLAGKHTGDCPEPGARWKMDLMRTIRLAQPRREPVAGLGPVAWKWAGAALATTLLLSVVSAHYGGMEDYLMLQSDISETADYLLTHSL